MQRKQPVNPSRPPKRKEPASSSRGASTICLPISQKTGDLISADHKVFNVENESRPGHREALVLQDHISSLLHSYLRKRTKPCRFSQKHGRIYTDDSTEPITAYSTLRWAHDTSTSHRSQTSGGIEGPAHRINGRHSGYIGTERSTRKMWFRATECHCFILNGTDKEADGDTS